MSYDEWKCNKSIVTLHYIYIWNNYKSRECVVLYLIWTSITMTFGWRYLLFFSFLPSFCTLSSWLQLNDSGQNFFVCFYGFKSKILTFRFVIFKMILFIAIHWERAARQPINESTKHICNTELPLLYAE